MEVSGPGSATTPAPPETAAAAPASRGWLADLAMGGGRRFPAAAGIATFLVFTVVLLVRNAYLFSTKIYENQDFAANTIAVLQAKHFELLTGNYSKYGFFHPGPAFLYIMAAGESLFHDALHLVPTPWNGQLLAILLLNSALIGAAIAVIARHAGSLQVVLICLAVALAFVSVHPLTVNSAWFPYMYFAPTLLMLVSAASVATGQTFALPLLAFSAWLCIHGQAEFLLFAPATVVVALVGLFAAHRQDPYEAIRSARGQWIAAIVISALFALPIVLYTAEHWPGEFGLYLDYRGKEAANIHNYAATSVDYVLRYWWPGTPTHAASQGGRYVLLALAVVAVVLAWRCPIPTLRRFCLWLLVMAGVLSVLFAGYAQTSIDSYDIATQSYIGYFYWAAPLAVLLVVGAGAVAYLPRWRTAVIALMAVVTAAAVVAAIVPQRQDNPSDPPAKYYGVPQLPQLVRTLARDADGRPIEITILSSAWNDAVGVVAYADRTGVRTCVGGYDEQRWVYLFRPQSICTAGETRTAFRVWFSAGNAPVGSGQVEVARLREALVTRLAPTAR